MAKAHIFVQLEEDQKNKFDIALLQARQDGEDINKSTFVRDCIDAFNNDPAKFIIFLDRNI